MAHDESKFELLKTIGALTADGLFVYCIPDNRLEYVNHAMVSIFDMSHVSFYSQPDFFINHIMREDAEHLLDEFERLKTESVVENVEFRLKSHDKQVRMVSCSAYKIDNLVIGRIRDITRERENETYTINFGAKKDTLLDMISHNLSGPLHLSRDVISSLDEKFGSQLDEPVRKHLQVIRESTAWCIDIVSEFLEEEHLTSEHISVRRTRFDLIELIDEMLEGMRVSYHHIRFLKVADSTYFFVESDKVKLMQVLQNLLSNATKFTPSGGQVELIVMRMGRSFSISVRDTGIGIPESLKPTIFDKYTAAGRDGLRGEPSIGMGLYIVRKLVAMLNGRLTFESEEGKGSVFTIQFESD